MSEIQHTTIPVVELARTNADFRRVVQTGSKLQVVLMAVPAGRDIGAETHAGHDQVLVFVEGEGRAIVGDTETRIGPGSLTFVPSDTYHNVINDGDRPLKLYTLYGPPEHAPGTEHETKAEAEAQEAH